MHPNDDCAQLSDKASTSTSASDESYSETNGNALPYNLIIIPLPSGTTMLSFTMDEPSCSLTGDATIVHVQSPLSRETVINILPLTNITSITVTHSLNCLSPNTVSSENVPMADDVASIVDPTSVSDHSDEVTSLPTATTESQNTTRTSTTTGSYCSTY